MILGTFEKQPAESLDYDIDFSAILDDGDLLATSGDPPVPIPLDVVVSPSGLTLGPTFVLADGKTYKQWLSGGTSGVRYKLTVTATSNAGRVKQVEFVVRVKDE
jgi:hypothetical protein